MRVKADRGTREPPQWEPRTKDSTRPLAIPTAEEREHAGCKRCVSGTPVGHNFLL